MAERFVEVKLQGFEDITRKLRMLKERMREQVMRKAMRSGASVVAAQAKRQIQAAGVVDTGSAQKGIAAIALRTKPGKPQVIAKVGVRSGRNARTRQGSLRKGLVRDPFYWWFHELGTQKIQARPFMQPALPAASARAVERIRSVAERELARLMSQGGR